jgi:hypothetical protein
MFSFVPLEISCTIDDEKCIIWKSPRSPSTRFCRLIIFLFKKETAENTREKVNNVETQIDTLNTTALIYNDGNLKFEHKLIFSMVDGKVNLFLYKTLKLFIFRNNKIMYLINAPIGMQFKITFTSTQKCYICGCSQNMPMILIKY